MRNRSSTGAGERRLGIEVDNDIPGRYESFLHPEAKLKAIHDVAEAAHKVGQPRVRLYRRDGMHHRARR